MRSQRPTDAEPQSAVAGFTGMAELPKTASRLAAGALPGFRAGDGGGGKRGGGKVKLKKHVHLWFPCSYMTRALLSCER